MTFFQFLALKLLPLAVAAYAGDIFCCEPSATTTSGFWDFKALAELLGFPTSGKKDQTPSYDVYLLGAAVSLDSSSIQATACPERIGKLRDHISLALQTNNLSPADASKLRGKWGFYNSLLAGKLGRGMMGKHIARQYYRRSPSLTPPLRRNLLWRYSALGNLKPRRTNFVLGQPVGAHTDAQGRGHVAAVFTEGGKTTVSTHLPKWFHDWVSGLPGESPIFLYELSAAILMVFCSLGWPCDGYRTCVLCVENKAAVATLVKGSSTSPAGTLLANLL